MYVCMYVCSKSVPKLSLYEMAADNFDAQFVLVINKCAHDP